MKVTHTKKKGRAWTLVLETEEEAAKLVHTFGCRNAIRDCNNSDVRTEKFQEDFYSSLIKTKMPV